MAAFAGFDKDAIAFLHELTIEMNKEWFEANKARYQRVWVEPLTALLEDVRAKVAKTYAPIKLAPHVFRIYRDVRWLRAASRMFDECARAQGGPDARCNRARCDRRRRRHVLPRALPACARGRRRGDDA